MKKTIFYLLGTMLMLVSCNKVIPPENPLEDNNYFSIEASEPEGDYDTKSQFTDNLWELKTNCNLWVYDHATGNKLADFYFDDWKDLKISGSELFPNGMEAEYDVYIFTNVWPGEKRTKVNAPATASQAKAYRYTFYDYSKFKDSGFPMASHYQIIPSKADSHILLANRLVSRYNVTITNNKANTLFSLQSVSSKQAAGNISLFSESAAQYPSDLATVSDFFVNSDIPSIANPTYDKPYQGYIYLLENIQGELFSSDATRKDRNLNALNSKYQPITTYLEFKGKLKYNNNTGWNNVTLKYIFGAKEDGTGSFVGIRRNKFINLKLDISEIFENGDKSNDDWGIEAENPYGYDLGFVENFIYVSPSANSKLSVYCTGIDGLPSNKIKYTLDYNKSEFQNAGITIANADGIHMGPKDFTVTTTKKLTKGYNVTLRDEYGDEMATAMITTSVTTTFDIISTNFEWYEGHQRILYINTNPTCGWILNIDEWVDGLTFSQTSGRGSAQVIITSKENTSEDPRDLCTVELIADDIGGDNWFDFTQDGADVHEQDISIRLDSQGYIVADAELPCDITAWTTLGQGIKISKGKTRSTEKANGDPSIEKIQSLSTYYYEYFVSSKGSTLIEECGIWKITFLIQ